MMTAPWVLRVNKGRTKVCGLAVSPPRGSGSIHKVAGANIMTFSWELGGTVILVL